ncbi:MAG: hypothetical protein A2452_05995 [Candidatus Firestonebacteria bacterium RIFOXYC2_FULL_39_67]|nr:MAG: hypothetical protein A2536_12470 [Candidatus Firestonebacteria bacterium RIFOXYD2_FULL_39_29]OGF56639.1 MAG: hypothetical protein A2452_05995 [Candidatus Firestonebacteria bacterium RIFOXYC2_FULL_39_67]OGF57115.1 MAG: hypothetical protein A2497_04540 [Candidatus Firestonebacteria bacterium RifOxyC12_full_39_7]
MKKLLTSLVLLIAVTGFSYGGEFVVDTTVGAYLTPSSTLMWYRDTGVTYNKLPLNLGVRVSHKVYDGFALTGTNENYRITGLVFMPFDKIVSGISVSPFAGAALNNSTDVTGSISINAGFDSTLKLLSFAGFTPVVGGEVLFFTDAKQAEYYGGFEYTVIPNLKAAALYSALYTSGQHKIGFGVKVSYTF